MIKFFRKIRQLLVTENKLGKYLIYAIGEIVLVIIGILIALSINKEQAKVLRVSKGNYPRDYEGVKEDLVFVNTVTNLFSAY
ncbi:MAG: hypothetical protein WBB27_06690 [Maribacter sp.]